jgi:hypothetical protein
MQIKQTTVASILANLSPIDRTSRRKNLTGEELAKLTGDAIRGIRSVLTTLRRLGGTKVAPKKAVAKKPRSKR